MDVVGPGGVPVMRRAAVTIATLAALLVLPAGASAQGAACTKTWSGPATGTWATAGNWTPAGAPGASDVVCLGATTDTTVNAATSVVAVRSDGIVRATAILTLTGAAEPSRLEDLRTSTGIAGAGDLEVDALTWTGGTMAGTGTTTVRETHTIGGGSVGDGRSIVTEGTGVWTTSINGAGSATWTNRADITFGPGDLNATVVGGVRPRFLNQAAGSLLRTNSGGNYNIAWQLDNDGAVGRADDPAVGRVWVDYATGASSGTFDDVNLTASPLQLGRGAVISRASISGDVVLGGGTLTATNLQIAGGSLTGPGTVVLQGHFHAYYGVLGTPDTLAILPVGQTMEWTHAFGMRARRFETAGEVTVTETGLGRPQTTWGARTVWENTGTVRIKSGLFPTLAGDEAARFVNRGLLVKETTSSFTFRPWLINDGVIEVQGGRLVATQYEQTTDGTTRFDVHGPGVSSGYGQVQAATLRYAGRLEAVLTGGYVPAAAARHDVFSVSTAFRSGAFGSTSLSGLTLDEAAPSTIGLVQPAAAFRASAEAALVASSAGGSASAAPAAASVVGSPSAAPDVVRSSAQRSVAGRVSRSCRAARMARSRATSRRARRAATKRVTRACRAARPAAR